MGCSHLEALGICASTRVGSAFSADRDRETDARDWPDPDGRRLQGRDSETMGCQSVRLAVRAAFRCAQSRMVPGNRSAPLWIVCAMDAADYGICNAQRRESA